MRLEIMLVCTLVAVVDSNAGVPGRSKNIAQNKLIKTRPQTPTAPAKKAIMGIPGPYIERERMPTADFLYLRTLDNENSNRRMFLTNFTHYRRVGNTFILRSPQGMRGKYHYTIVGGPGFNSALTVAKPQKPKLEETKKVETPDPVFTQPNESEPDEERFRTGDGNQNIEAARSAHKRYEADDKPTLVDEQGGVQYIRDNIVFIDPGALRENNSENNSEDKGCAVVSAGDASAKGCPNQPETVAKLGWEDWLTNGVSNAPDYLWRKPTLGTHVGFCTHDLSPTVQTALLETKIGWARVSFNWNSMQPEPDVIEWGHTDQLVKDADELGINLYATLAYTPAWAARAGPKEPYQGSVPQSPELFKNFVKKVVSRYKDSIKYWGLWNEPNLKGFWEGSIDQFIEYVLIPGATGAKEADPDCKVLGLDLASIRTKKWDKWLGRALDKAGELIDIVTQHSYGGGDPYDIYDLLDGDHKFLGLFLWPWDRPSIRSVMEDHNAANKPFWLTETGKEAEFGDRDEERQQSNFYITILKGMDSRPWWEKTFFYDLQDSPNVDLLGVITGGDLAAGEDPIAQRKDAFYKLKERIQSRNPVPIITSPTKRIKTENSAEGVLKGFSIQANALVTLDGSISYSPNSTITKYEWAVDENNGSESPRMGQTVTHRYSLPGVYFVTLTVEDKLKTRVFRRIRVEVTE